MTLCEISATTRSTQASRKPVGRHLRPSAKVEIALLALLYVGYSLGRLVGHAGMPTAVANARDLLHLEALLHLNIEKPVNKVLDSVPLLALLAATGTRCCTTS
jgi:hypothetical protein